MVDKSNVTDADLLELCPAEFKAAFKKAKKIGARADLLFTVDKARLAEQKKVDAIEKFTSKLKEWFIQELPLDDSTGVAGTVANVRVVSKTRPSVVDWDKFYAYIKKKSAFDLLNRAVNRAAAQERWEAGVEVPGLEAYKYKSISLTSVKKK